MAVYTVQIGVCDIENGTGYIKVVGKRATERVAWTDVLEGPPETHDTKAGQRPQGTLAD